MIVANLLALAVLGLAPADDPAELVGRLGAARYAEREAAATALEKLGRQALSALREGLGSQDAEIRARAAALLEKIENDLLVSPTMLTLDFEDQPLDEVAKAISSQAGIALLLEPENHPMWKTQRVSLHESAPLPFWKAIDRLCTEAGLSHNPASHVGLTGRGPSYRLYSGTSPVVPTSDSGPFRVTLNGVHLHRDLSLAQVQTPLPPVPALVPGLPRPAGGGAVIINRRLPDAQMPAGGGPAAVTGRTVSEQFFVDLQVMTEPRLMLTQGHEIQLTEAVDELGQSLLANPPGGKGPQGAGFYGYSAGAFVQIPVYLKRPENPGKTIKRLRGTMPVMISARKSEPLVVPLAPESVGKTFRSNESDAVLQLIKIDTDANNPRTNINFSLTPQKAAANGAGQDTPFSKANVMRMPNMAQNQLEVVDAQGKVIQAFPSNIQNNGERMSITLTLMQMAGAGIPAQLRYYSLATATTELSFEFTDIPTP